MKLDVRREGNEVTINGVDDDDDEHAGLDDREAQEEEFWSKKNVETSRSVSTGHGQNVAQLTRSRIGSEVRDGVHCRTRRVLVDEIRGWARRGKLAEVHA